MRSAVLFALTIGVAFAQQGEAPSAKPSSLDYEFFKTRVQPIFLAKRPGHARCIECHDNGTPRLQDLSPGATAWNEEQSRKNFESWKRVVVPGNPMASRLLMHPLAVEAGGDRFHAGGKHWKSKDDPEWQTLYMWVMGLTAASSPRVIQTNSAGDNVTVIDPATNKVVGSIGDIDVPHGVTIAPDGSRIYITEEPTKTLDVVDAKSLKVVKKIPLSGRPNNVAVSKDGLHVYAGIAQAPGAVDVIDTASLTNAKTIPVDGAVHNVYVTPDGRFAVSGSIVKSVISVIDTATNTVAWSVKMSSGIRPMAFIKASDGSTKDIIVQLSNLHGFAVVDFATHKEVKRIALPDVPGQERETDGIQGAPAHGLAISADGQTLWATSKYYDYVAAYSLPDYKLLKVIPVGLHPEWLTIPPDGKDLYVACAGDDATVVVDTKTMAVVARIPVGAVPKRNTSGMLQTE